MPKNFTDREVKAWREGKDRPRPERKKLNAKQEKRFLELVAELKSPVYFELDLGLNARDVEHYKKELGVESQEEARRLLRIKNEQETGELQKEIQEAERQQREAEAAAQKRLEQMAKEHAERRRERHQQAKKDLDPNKLHQDDADRQKRFVEQQQKKAAERASMEDWRLELDGIKDDELKQTFMNDIKQRGLTFCGRKYDANPREIKAEAIRLGLDINWDLVPR